jgi:DNA-binding transcriptional MerR regulator
MTDLGPSEFSAATGLSAKALRIYEARGLLVPAVDPANGRRRYRSEEVLIGARIALLRRAGISLAEIRDFLDDPSAATIARWLAQLDVETAQRRHVLEELAHSMRLSDEPREAFPAVVIRPVTTQDELESVFDLLGRQFEPPFDHTDRTRYLDVAVAFADQRGLLLVAEVDGREVGGALGFLVDRHTTLRVLAVADGHRRQGIGRALLQRFESAAGRLGATDVSLGADDVAAGFYVRHGYRTLLLLQWANDPSHYEDDVQALLNGPLAEMDHTRESFRGIPQLFVTLDEPDPTVRATALDIVHGAHVGYCMTRSISSPAGTRSTRTRGQ